MRPEIYARLPFDPKTMTIKTAKLVTTFFLHFEFANAKQISELQVFLKQQSTRNEPGSLAHSLNHQPNGVNECFDNETELQ